ncbi:beta-ketoacyl synthase N-terminal-like domain-containing protein [Micromonospora sp. M12]
MTRQVLVTGMAWDTALGDDLDGVWSRLLAGETGLREVPSSYRLRNRLAATVDDPPGDWPPARRQVALGTWTVSRAVRHAGIEDDLGAALLVLGTSYGAHLDDTRVGGLHDWAAAVAVGSVSPARRCRCRRRARPAPTRSWSVATWSPPGWRTWRSAAGGHPHRGQTARPQRAGHHVADPVARLRPGRRRHVAGEGAGIVVLEEAGRARRRGARAYAELLGGGSANDAAGMTAPDPSGAAVLLAVRRSSPRPVWNPTRSPW